jgi:acetolactate synthase I/II/III large subunit
VLVDLPKDVQLEKIEVDWDVPMNLPGYGNPVAPPQAKPEQINQVVAAIKRAKRPLVYCGGG